MSRKRLLLADDEPVYRDNLADHLRSKRPHLDVITAEDGETALEILRQGSIDVLVTDIRMPGLGGLGLLQALDDEAIEVVVIIATAYSDEAVRTQARRSGALVILEKPLDIHRLLLSVDQALGPNPCELRGISIAGFLQLIQMERKSCRVLVRIADTSGNLDFDQGILIAASQEDLSGDPAVLEIASWHHAEISLEAAPPSKQINVESTLTHLLMEAARRQDEEGHDNSDYDTGADEEMAAFVKAAESSGRAPALPASLVQGAHLDRLEQLAGFSAAAILDPDGDEPAYAIGTIGNQNAAEAARRFAESLSSESDTLHRAGSVDKLEKSIVRTREHCHFLYGLGPMGLLYAAFEAQSLNLALAMRELDTIAGIYSTEDRVPTLANPRSEVGAR